MNARRLVSGALAAMGCACVVSACDVVLGYDEAPVPLADMNFCDCFIEQGQNVLEECEPRFQELVSMVGGEVSLVTMSEIAERCSSCSDDVDVIVSCHQELPGLAAVGEPCVGPEDCASLACCPTTFEFDSSAFNDQAGKGVTEGDFRCCDSCMGCGGTIEGDICKGSAEQAANLALSLSATERRTICPPPVVGPPPPEGECKLITSTYEEAISCYNCLVSKDALNLGLCAAFPSRPVDPSAEEP